MSTFARFAVLPLAALLLSPLAASARGGSVESVPGVADDPHLSSYGQNLTERGYASGSARSDAPAYDKAVSFIVETDDDHAVLLRMDPISGEIKDR